MVGYLVVSCKQPDNTEYKMRFCIIYVVCHKAHHFYRRDRYHVKFELRNFRSWSFPLFDRDTYWHDDCYDFVLHLFLNSSHHSHLIFFACQVCRIRSSNDRSSCRLIRSGDQQLDKILTNSISRIWSCLNQ
jgi:hypothetical protein